MTRTPEPAAGGKGAAAANADALREELEADRREAARLLARLAVRRYLRLRKEKEDS